MEIFILKNHNNQNNLEQQKTAGGITVQDFKLYCRAKTDSLNKEIELRTHV